MILLAFLLPFTVYVLVLGAVNRRRRPVMVPGIWDFAGVLFAASGFLLFVGPAVLSSRSEGTRLFWAAGRAGDGGAVANLWVFLALVYFGVVISGASFLLWRRRDTTSVYNLDARSAEESLTAVFDHFGITPVRSGSLFFFGADIQNGEPHRPSGTEGIQGPHYLPPFGRGMGTRSREEPQRGNRFPVAGSSAPEFHVHSVILEVESFELLRHVTLRWDPPDSVVRQEVEGELGRSLAKRSPSYNPAGDWLFLTGLFLACVWLLSFSALVVYRVYAP